MDKIDLEAEKNALLAMAWTRAEEFLLDIGLGLDENGDRDERELMSRRRALEERLGAVWNKCVAEWMASKEDGAAIRR